MAIAAGLFFLWQPMISAQNLITNGSFENWTTTTPALDTAITGFSGTPPVSTVSTGWTIVAPTPSTTPWVDRAASTLTNTTFSQDAGGARAIAFNTDTGKNYLKQNVTLTNGTSYRLAFDTRQEGAGGDMTLSVYISSTLTTIPAALQTFTLPATATSTSTMSTSWTTQSSSNLLFSQLSGTYTLAFEFTGPGGTSRDIGLDRVSLTPVPEPASITLVSALFAGCFYRRLRNR